MCFPWSVRILDGEPDSYLSWQSIRLRELIVGCPVRDPLAQHRVEVLDVELLDPFQQNLRLSASPGVVVDSVLLAAREDAFTRLIRMLGHEIADLVLVGFVRVAIEPTV